MEINIKEQLKAGELFVGIILGKEGAPDEGVILLPGQFTGNHADAVKWAESIGGTLPARREQSLLFANRSEEFEPAWYWAAEQLGSSTAWMQHFNGGSQNYYYRSDSCHARAVRRFKIFQTTEE